MNVLVKFQLDQTKNVGCGDWQQEVHYVVGQVKRRATKMRPKADGSDIFGRFSNFDKCWPEVAGDVISGGDEPRSAWISVWNLVILR